MASAAPRPALHRLPVLALGLAALLAGLYAGLSRLGFSFTSVRSDLGLVHGALMVSGFFGTLIGLERAVALGTRWAYATPLLAGAGTLALLGGVELAILAYSLAAISMCAVSLVIALRQRAGFTLTMALGAGCFAAGNLLWLLGEPFFRVAPWWAGFLVLTIAGERLELNRVMAPRPGARQLFALAVVAMLGGLALGLVSPDLGARLLGLSQLGLAAWLASFDVARRTVRRSGLTRYVAVCLLAGYVWLAAAGLLGMAYGALRAGPLYDAALHTLFVGFVFSMVFGHAPIIFPAVLRVPIRYQPSFYAPLALLHAALALRVTGDLLVSAPLRSWGALASAVAILLFLLHIPVSLVRARLRGRQPVSDSTPQIPKGHSWLGNTLS